VAGRTPAQSAEPVAPHRPEGSVGHALIDAGLSAAAVQAVLRLAPGETDALPALALALSRLEVPYPDEERRAVITMQGPEGAGRTTALLRMALDCADSGRATALVAADTSRAAARDQMLQYGEATGLPTYDCPDPEEVVKAVMQARPGSCLFADVSAGSVELPAMLGVTHHAYLAVPGHWQAGALQHAVSGLATASFSGCVITHTDLSTDLSPALSLALEAGLGVAFLSSGRDVSGGLEAADAEQLASGILRMTSGETSNGRLVASA
jgi:flagellar biosynthesis GTPase FlhF